jgi:hypothetical protein
MALETNFNVSPYFDDFETSAKVKRYHKILFKPGVAVQTRELTQLQSMLQEQVARFGSNIYKEGTIIDGCDFQYDANVAFVKLRDNFGSNSVTTSVFANVIVQGATSGVRAKVIATTAGTEAGAPNYNTFLVKYLDGGTSKTNKTFVVNEQLVYLPADGGSGQRANTITSAAFGFGSIFHIGGGIIFQKGNFINVESQVIILEKYSNKPSAKVGFTTTEAITTSSTDTTLLDNATGSFNYNAPGADRLKLTPTLVKKGLTDTSNTTNFLPIFEVKAGKVLRIKDDTQFNSIGRELAKRTYEESGNYQLKQINTHVKEHLNTGTNFGRFTAGESGDKDKLAIGIEPGVAYIQGYRNETLATEFIATTKAITTNTETSLSVTTNFGNYVMVNELAGPWDPTTLQTVSLRSVARKSISTTLLGTGAAAGVEIGTAKLRGVAHSSGTMGQKGGTYRLYLFDISMGGVGATKDFGDVRGFYVNNASGPDNHCDSVLETVVVGTTGGGSTASTVTKTVLKEPDFNKGVFRLGTNATKQVKTTAGSLNATYEFRDKATLSFSTAGVGVLSLSGVHAGGTEEFTFGTGALNATQKRTIQVVTSKTAQTASLPGLAKQVQGAIANTLMANTLIGNTGCNWTTSLKVGDYISVSNSGGTGSVTTKVVTISNNSVMVTNPAIGVLGSFHALAAAGAAGTGKVHKIFPTGYIFDLTANGAGGTLRTSTINSTTQMTVDLKETIANTTNMTVFFNNKRESAAAISKTVRKSRFIRLNLAAGSGIAGPWFLGVADVFNLRAVYVGPSYSTSNRNLVKEFRIIRNSDDSIYRTSKLAIKNTSTVVLKTTDRLVVEIDYFDHSRSGGIGFASIDSYIIDPNESTSNTTAIVTPEIPRYVSATSGTYNLRDTLDFRPRVKSNANTNETAITNAAVNPVANTTLDVDSDGSYVPVPDATFTSDVVYYMPRVDRVVMGKDGKKKIISGIASDKPFPPREPAEAISLSLLYIPPFPSLSLENARTFTDPQTGGSRDDLAVKVKPIFQRRFTMRDLSGLEDRIDRLEYYTALNVLEKAAKDLSIPDGNGLDRFKNGIFVDAFFGHTNANLTDPAYAVSIDKLKGELRPKFESQNIDIEFSSALSSNVSLKGKQIRLDVSSNTDSYQNDDIVYQGGSLGGASAAGTVRSVVANSTIVRLYLHNANGTFTATTVKTNGSSKTSTLTATSRVQTPTSGELLTLPYTADIYIDQPYASKLINPVGELSFNWIGDLKLFPESDHHVDTTTQPDTQFDLDLASNFQTVAQAFGTQFGDWNDVGEPRETVEVRGTAFTNLGDGTQGQVGSGTFGGEAHGAIDDVKITTTQEQVRTGTRLNVTPFNRVQRSGPFLTRTDVVPFMRSRLVNFTATGMRPNTRVFPYFDDILVNDYVKPSTKEYANTGVFGAALNTNANGAVFGVFVVPNNDTLKFRLGERPFKLVDISNTTTQSGTQTTTATKTYVSIGLASAQRGISLNTREASISVDTVTDRRDAISTFEGIQVHRDPVAQSFTVGNFEFQNLDFADTKFGNGADGVFISAIDLYFQAKSTTSGIGVEIREVVNGNITAVRVPFGFKRIDPEDVNISATGASPTPFYFDTPVYLRGDQDYAFIVKPDGSNPDYRLWISELGGIDTVTNAIIDQQPAVGLLFTSANDKTYSPRQNQDICFTIWRANFQTNLTGSSVFTNENDEYLNATQFSSTRFDVGEKIRGESIIKMTSAASTIAVNDLVIVKNGANTGKVRKVILAATVAGSGAGWFHVDMKGSVADGRTLTFTSGASSYEGVVNTSIVNTATGFIQYADPTRQDIVANGSTGGFTSNTTADNGFYRGQVTNASAQVYSVRDYKYDVLVPKISSVRYVDTALTFTANTTANNYALSQTPVTIESFRDNVFPEGERVIAGRSKEIASTGSAKSLRITGTLTSETDRLSPVIDIGSARSVVVVHNIINNLNTGEQLNNGLAAARYITKKIVLADGQEAEDLKVVLTAYKPTGTNVDVYTKIQNAEDGDDFSDKHYTLMTQTTPSNTVSSIVDTEDFFEFEYGMPSTNASALGAFRFSGNNNVVRYYNSSNAHFDSYKSFSLKIVLRSSTGSHLVPRVKDLRAIALQV